MNAVRVKVYGKINLFLKVTGSLGCYHTLDTVMASVSCADVLTVFKSEDTQVFEDGEKKQNYNAYKAAKKMCERFGLSGIRAEINGGIFGGGGMGRSSAAAAGIIIAANELFGLNADKKTLSEIAFEVGSDVPYMLYGGLGRLLGTGTETEYYGYSGEEDILLAAKGRVNTGECFKAFDGLNNFQPDYDGEKVIKEISAKSIKGAGELFYNALEGAAKTLNPYIEEAQEKMRGLRAVKMTGSGAAVFAIDGRDKLEEVERQLKKADFCTALVTVKKKGVEFI